MLIHELLDFHAGSRRDSIMAKFGEQTTTYAEAKQRSVRLASALVHLGIRKGDRVSVLMENSIDNLIVFYAILRCGAVAVPLNCRLVPQECLNLIIDSDSVALIVDERFRTTFEDIALPEFITLVAGGKTVFVDVTADWCVTCQWNKKTVLEVGAIADWLSGPDVVAMKADWTQPDPVIADFLSQHGRYGIPFNIVYGPAAPQGIALPELLSAGAVKSAAVQADPQARIATSD